MEKGLLLSLTIKVRHVTVAERPELERRMLDPEDQIFVARYRNDITANRIAAHDGQEFRVGPDVLADIDHKQFVALLYHPLHFGHKFACDGGDFRIEEDDSDASRSVTGHRITMGSCLEIVSHPLDNIDQIGSTSPANTKGNTRSGATQIRPFAASQVLRYTADGDVEIFRAVSVRNNAEATITTEGE